MPRFRFTAIDAQGNSISGEREAPDTDAVSEWLRIQKFDVCNIEPATVDTKPADGKPAQFTPREVQTVSGHLGDLAAAGLPLAAGLRALAEDLPINHLRQELLRMVQHLEAGGDLASVLKASGGPSDLCALIEAGVRMGNMEGVLQKYAMQVQTAAEIRRSSALALAYPAVVIGVGASIVLFMAIFLVPQFKSIFEGFGVQLPGMTVLLIFISDAIVNSAGILVVLFAITILGLVLAARNRSVRLFLRRAIGVLPLIGPLLRWSAMARFSQLLALLVENHIPFPSAVLLAGEGTGDLQILTASRRLAAEVEAGQPPALVARELGLFPTSFLQTLVWATRPDGFADALRALGDMLQGRARMQASLIGAIAEPAAIVVMALVVGFIVISLFAPLIKLLNDLS